MRGHSRSAQSLILFTTVLASGCQDRDPTTAATDGSPAATAFKAGLSDSPYEEIGPTVWGIATAADGGVLVARNTTFLESRANGREEIRTVTTIP